jgi:hypothetical protein
VSSSNPQGQGSVRLEKVWIVEKWDRVNLQQLTPSARTVFEVVGLSVEKMNGGWSDCVGVDVRVGKEL